jgi:hypothetical protein
MSREIRIKNESQMREPICGFPPNEQFCRDFKSNHARIDSCFDFPTDFCTKIGSTCWNRQKEGGIQTEKFLSFEMKKASSARNVMKIPTCRLIDYFFMWLYSYIAYSRQRLPFHGSMNNLRNFFSSFPLSSAKNRRKKEIYLAWRGRFCLSAFTS